MTHKFHFMKLKDPKRNKIGVLLVWGLGVKNCKKDENCKLVPTPK